MNNDDYSGATKTERIVKYAMANTRLGSDVHERTYAVLNEEPGNSVTLPLSSKGFQSWLRRHAFRQGDLLKVEDISEAQNMLAAHAEFEGDDMAVWQRVAPLSTGGVELDLADNENTRVLVEPGAVSITGAGSEILFSRSVSTRALPMPAEKGDWRGLLPFLNINEDEQLLLIGWITYTLAHPRESLVGYPILVVKGEQGAGKSFLCKAILRALIDPNNNGIQIFPKDPKDMAISSLNAFMLIYDNIRKLSHTWSDALCVAATSGVLSSRKLYSDCDESSISLHVALVLNGIHSFIQEADLASRCVNVNLLPISPGERKHEKELEARLALLLPSIFRGLLDLIAQIFAVLDSVEVTHAQRMIGYVQWLAAMETVLGFPVGKLQNIYANSQKQAMLDTIQDDYLAQAILSFADRYKNKSWVGTPTELLARLNNIDPLKVINNSRLWPQNAIALSKRLSTLQKVLSTQGVELQLGVRGKQRRIVLGMKAL